ncbi:hypothetical protein H4219_002782 [Mycoemilia scoparia]|uniref:Uncharacterized protein n=1 Tax=Mycoemilia scoparia TaxID=417184 RepID=A0A9W8DTK8_9FUNG|nr:hypothetical protein H4219_002782 [Mycoemilia scoparia]
MYGNNYGGGYPPNQGSGFNFPGDNSYPPPPPPQGGDYYGQPPQQQGYPASNYQGNINSPPPNFANDEEAMFANANFDESMNLDQMISQMTGSDIKINEDELNNSTRSIQGFDPDALQSNYSQFRDLTGDVQGGERGLFSFGGQGKSPLSHQLLAGAAAWMGMKWWETKQRNENKPVSHAGKKKFAAAAAAALAVRFWEKSGGWQSGISRDVVAREAAQNAMLAYDSKHAAESQPQYNYNYSTAGGEAASFDGFGQQAPPPQGGGGYYGNQPPHQGGYPPY